MLRDVLLAASEAPGCPFVRDGAVAYEWERTSRDSWVKTLPCCKSKVGMPIFGTELSTTRLRGFALVAWRRELDLAGAAAAAAPLTAAAARDPVNIGVARMSPTPVPGHLSNPYRRLAAAPDTGRAGHRLLTAGMSPGDGRATFDQGEDQDGRG
jgi:hypothetical protein